MLGVANANPLTDIVACTVTCQQNTYIGNIIMQPCTSSSHLSESIQRCVCCCVAAEPQILPFGGKASDLPHLGIPVRTH